MLINLMSVQTLKFDRNLFPFAPDIQHRRTSAENKTNQRNKC